MSAESEDWIDDLIDNVVSDIQRSGWCDRVNEYEPIRKPGHGVTAAVWPQYLGPTRTSGLASTSARVNVFVRLYKALPIGQPKVPAYMDMIDRRLLKAASNLIRRYHDDFDFEGTIRNVDLLGSEGQMLEGVAGYLEIDKTVFRTITITVPCIVNDAWPQVN